MKKAKQPFYYLPVPAWQVVKSFKVVMISVLYVKNTHTCRFLINL